jgi:outer membrane biosynthesis protein TonB
LTDADKSAHRREEEEEEEEEEKKKEKKKKKKKKHKKKKKKKRRPWRAPPSFALLLFLASASSSTMTSAEAARPSLLQPPSRQLRPLARRTGRHRLLRPPGLLLHCRKGNVCLLLGLPDSFGLGTKGGRSSPRNLMLLPSRRN